MEWGISVISKDNVSGKRVLEVGSLNENGSLREYVVGHGPAEYIGVDLRWGPGVDRLIEAGHLLTTYGEEAFDIVISTEMLEHAEWWQMAIWNMKAVTRTGGSVVLTTRSPGFGYHPFPEDWWRFEPSDLWSAFADWHVTDLVKDPGEPGAFIRATRPADWDRDAGWGFVAGLEAARAPTSW